MEKAWYLQKSVWDKTDVDRAAAELFEDVEECLDATCKKEEPKVSIPGFGWWSSELAALKREVRRKKDYFKRQIKIILLSVLSVL